MCFFNLQGLVFSRIAATVLGYYILSIVPAYLSAACQKGTCSTNNGFLLKFSLYSLSFLFLPLYSVVRGRKEERRRIRKGQQEYLLANLNLISASN